MFLKIYNFVDSSPFLTAMFASLLSGVTIAVLFSLVFPRYYYKSLRKPKLFFLTRNIRERNIQLTNASDGNFEASAVLVIKNDGLETLRDFYWHLFIPKQLNPNLVPLALIKESYQIDNIKDNEGNEWTHFNSLTSEPLYPNSYMKFPYEIKIKTSEAKKYKIFYFFNTAYGSYPPKAKGLNKKSSIADLEKHWAKIEILPPIINNMAE